VEYVYFECICPGVPVAEGTPRFREAFERLSDEIRAVPADEPVTSILDVPTAVATALGVLPSLALFRARVADLPGFAMRRFDGLEKARTASERNERRCRLGNDRIDLRANIAWFHSHFSRICEDDKRPGRMACPERERPSLRDGDPWLWGRRSNSEQIVRLAGAETAYSPLLCNVNRSHFIVPGTGGHER
jgi:hypothetical protein